MKFITGFSDDADIAAQFAAPKGALDGAEVLFAAYTYEDYSGDALVVFRKDGRLFEVNGGHCSCYGLEDQWSPEETTTEALLHRLDKGSRYGLLGYFGEQLRAALLVQ